jgi:hypothetical protein
MTKEKGKCCLCGGDYDHWGNNASPIKDGRCCDACNQKVILARLDKIRRATRSKKEVEIERLFKGIYGTLIDKKYIELGEREIFSIAVMAIKQFADENGIGIEVDMGL